MSEGAKGAVFCTGALAPGLYFVATPIGAARDITLRALDILASAEVLAAEDTRSLRRLMEIHGVPLSGRPLIAYHDHNGQAKRPGLIARLEAGASLAYASEAGTPLVADPGYQLGHAAAQAGIPVFSAPGPSAALAALTVSGLPSDRFQFLGFAPPKGRARKDFLRSVAESKGTSILFEAPGRVKSILAELMESAGENREAALCRELTKRFEEVRRGNLMDLHHSVCENPPRGECVLVVDRADPGARPAGDIDAALQDALVSLGVKDASVQVAEAFGMPRRDVYQRALALKAGQNE